MMLGGVPATKFTMSRFLRLAFFNASASFWKRHWNEEGEATNTTPGTISPQEQVLVDNILLTQQRLGLSVPDLSNKMDLFLYLDSAMSSSSDIDASGRTMDMAASSSFMSILLGEFAGKSASNYNMPLEFHKQAHRTFEKEGWLNRSLQMSMAALSHTVNRLNSSGNGLDATDVESLALTVVQLTIDVIGWEFGTDAWDSGGFPHTGGKALVKPPMEWRQVLIRPEFVTAILHSHATVVRSPSNTSSQLGHSMRQLILLLTSISGPIFQSKEERTMFASILLEGILDLLSNAITRLSSSTNAQSELSDALSMVSRLIVNYRLSILVELPTMQSLHQGLADLGRHLLRDNLKECQAVQGDIESMENREFREEALALLLEGIVLLCGDPWLLYSGSEESRNAAKAALASTLGPLYAEFVSCRTQMARLEETYLAAHETELDEVREEIYAVDLEDEMTSLAIVGRLDVQASLSCLSGLFGKIVPQLQVLWNGQVGAVTAEAAGLLEESRLATMYIGNLLTDENPGETPVIPDAILATCQDNQQATDIIASAVDTLQQFAEFQASRIATHPSDPRLSPLLAKSFLWFLHRWAPAYILPAAYGHSTTPSTISLAWASEGRVNQSVSFILSLCLHYNCYWPHERQVQDGASSLILSMAKRCSKLRLAMMKSPSFRQLVIFHCLTCGIRHSAPPTEFEAAVRSKAGDVAVNMHLVGGYQRLPYEVKGQLLTGILVACSEPEDATSESFLNDCFNALHEAFGSLVNVLA